MERRFDSIGVRWKIIKGNVHTPPARDTGPNQILLFEDHFRNGFIEAVVQPVDLQPYLEPRRKTKMECSLLGRYQDPDNYITAGLGVHGEDLGITRVEEDDSIGSTAPGSPRILIRRVASFDCASPSRMTK